MSYETGETRRLARAGRISRLDFTAWLKMKSVLTMGLSLPPRKRGPGACPWLEQGGNGYGLVAHWIPAFAGTTTDS